MLELLAFALLQLSIFSSSPSEAQTQDAANPNPTTNTTNSIHGAGGWADNN